MSPLAIALLTWLIVFVAALFGLALRQRLPEHHLSKESQDTVRLVTGLLATLSALVLGLLIASAKNSFDTVDDGLKKTLAKVIVADRLLAEYGPEAAEARRRLKLHTQARFERLLSPAAGAAAAVSAGLAPAGAGGFDAALRALVPQDDAHRSLRARIQALSDEILQTQWLVFEQADGSMPPVFLLVIISWLSIMFLSFGLFSPRNWTTLTALFIAAGAVATAVLLMEEMFRPLDGLIAIPAEPIRQGLAQLGG